MASNLNNSPLLSADYASPNSYGLQSLSRFESVQQPQYDSAALVANHQIDHNLLQHENPNNCTDLAPALPLDKYKLNVDQNPHVVRKKPSEKIHYLQQVAVRYLKPPAPPKGGDIIVKQLPSKQIAPAPPLIVRQPGPKAPTPPPLVLREAPPPPPTPLPGKLLTVPGKVIPPPARKVVVEKLPPIPAKPQQVFIERWLPYGQQTQKVIYQPAKPACVIPDPKNVVIQWESPDVEVRKEVKNLGVYKADPREYISKYGSSLVRSEQLPNIAIQYANAPGLQLAANHKPPNVPILEGDVQALRLVDLDSAGLVTARQRHSPASQAVQSYDTQEYVSSESPYSVNQYTNAESTYSGEPILAESASALASTSYQRLN